MSLDSSNTGNGLSGFMVKHAFGVAAIGVLAGLGVPLIGEAFNALKGGGVALGSAFTPSL
jgi:hypothetical protein